MTSKNYCEKADLINRLVGDDVTPGDDDVQAMEQVIEGVSRMLENYCGRRFYTTSTDETRYYTAEFRDELYLADDVVSITTLQTDGDGDRTYEDTWAATDYDLWPFNAALDGLPYTMITITPDGDYSFPLTAKGVKIVGKFGWPALPAVVREACLLQCARLWKRKDAPFGIAGSPELGELRVIPELDQDVKLLLAGVRRLV